ncbi:MULTISPECIES: hypothetical protein, partial [Streptococcus]
TIQKPHSVSFSLIIFKTGITVWFYLGASFCPTSLIENWINNYPKKCLNYKSPREFLLDG